MPDEPLYSVTFLFPIAVVTTTIEGDDAIIPRASVLLKEHLGIDTQLAQEVRVHEHPQGT